VSPQASININRLVNFQCSIDVNSNGKLENSTCHEVQDLTLLQLCHTASAVRAVRSRDSDLNPQLGQCTMSDGGSICLLSASQFATPEPDRRLGDCRGYIDNYI
jgi:hypothetical protein